jgi:uncharacterized membrane-anchored protein
MTLTPMAIEAELVAQILAIVALLVATLEYREVVVRRAAERRRERLRVAIAAAEAAGLAGLVRVFLADADSA